MSPGEFLCRDHILSTIMCGGCNLSFKSYDDYNPFLLVLKLVDLKIGSCRCNIVKCYIIEL